MERKNPKRIKLGDPNINDREFCKLLTTNRKSLPLRELNLEQSSSNAIKQAKVQKGLQDQDKENEEESEEEVSDDEDENEDVFEMVPTIHGGETLWLNKNRKYLLSRKDVKTGKTYWRCAQARKKICTATAVTQLENGKIVGEQLTEHVCGPDIPGYEVAFHRASVKGRAIKSNAAAKEIVTEYRNALSTEEEVRAGKVENDLRAIERIRNKRMKEQIDAINAIDINITNEYSQNGEETFLRYDSKNDASKDYSAKKQRVLVFASNYGLDRLRTHKIWNIYDNFVRPRAFQNGLFLVIGSLVEENCLPSAYGFLSDNDQSLINEFFAQILSKTAHPNQVVTFFSSHILNGIRTIFSNSTIEGCLLAYFDDVWKEWIRLGLNKLFTKDVKWREFFRIIMALSFLPETLIHRAFHLVVASAENSDDRLKEFLYYMAKNYVGLGADENIESFIPKGRQIVVQSQSANISIHSTEQSSTINTSIEVNPSMNDNVLTSTRNESLAVAEEALELTLELDEAEQATAVIIQPTYPTNLWSVKKRIFRSLQRLNNAIDEMPSRFHAMRNRKAPELSTCIKALAKLEGKARASYLELSKHKKNNNKYILMDQLLNVAEQDNIDTDESIHILLRQLSFCLVNLNQTLGEYYQAYEENEKENETEQEAEQEA